MESFENQAGELVQWLSQSDQTAEMMASARVSVSLMQGLVTIRMEGQRFDIVEFFMTSDRYWFVSFYKMSEGRLEVESSKYKSAVPTGPAPGVVADFQNGERWAVSA